MNLNKTIFLVLFVFISACSAVDLGNDTNNRTIKNTKITSFEQCVSAGYPVMESFPRQCKIPSGKTLIEQLNNDRLPKSEFCGKSTKAPCNTSDDCIEGGCSAQICQSINEESMMTICDYKDCYDSDKYGVACVCLNGMCQWT